VLVGIKGGLNVKGGVRHQVGPSQGRKLIDLSQINMDDHPNGLGKTDSRSLLLVSPGKISPGGAAGIEKDVYNLDAQRFQNRSGLSRKSVGDLQP
jgi:hypothetical protein